MTKLALYESGEGKNDRGMSRFFRRDYIYKQNFRERGFILLGCVIAILIYILHIIAVKKEDLFAMLSTGEYTSELFKICAFIVLVLVIYTFLGKAKHGAAYEKAQKRQEQYYKLLSELEKRDRASAENLRGVREAEEYLRQHQTGVSGETKPIGDLRRALNNEN